MTSGRCNWGNRKYVDRRLAIIKADTQVTGGRFSGSTSEVSGVNGISASGLQEGIFTSWFFPPARQRSFRPPPASFQVLQWFFRARKPVESGAGSFPGRSGDVRAHRVAARPVLRPCSFPLRFQNKRQLRATQEPSAPLSIAASQWINGSTGSLVQSQPTAFEAVLPQRTRRTRRGEATSSALPSAPSAVKGHSKLLTWFCTRALIYSCQGAITRNAMLQFLASVIKQSDWRQRKSNPIAEEPPAC